MAPKAKLSDSAHLSAIVQSSADAIITKDLNGVITSWNGAAEQVFGYTADEAVGKPVTMLIPDDHLDEEPGILARIRRGDKIEHYETIRKRKDGRLIDISLTVSPIYNETGTVVGASKIVRDVSDRKRADAELTKLAAIVENSSDAIITKDLNGVITSWNHGAEQIFGYTADEVIGKPVTILMPEDRIDEEPGILARIRRGERVEHYETIRRRKDGTLLDIALTVSPVRDQHGEIIGASKIARDVTELKRMDGVERDAELLVQLIETQEAERRRIARDLHDHIGQYMTAMRLTLEGLERKAGDGELRPELATLKDLAERIDRDISFMTWQLRPAELEEHGLKEALGNLIAEWSEHCSIEATFEFVGDPEVDRLPDVIETNLYRIVQEALNNAAKHSEASSVSVMMNWQKNHLSIIVEDNGKGFDLTAAPERSAAGHGQGMGGMTERGESIGADLSVESTLGEGTSVIVRLPITKRRPRATREMPAPVL